MKTPLASFWYRLAALALPLALLAFMLFGLVLPAANQTAVLRGRIRDIQQAGYEGPWLDSAHAALLTQRAESGRLEAEAQSRMRDFPAAQNFADSVREIFTQAGVDVRKIQPGVSPEAGLTRFSCQLDGAGSFASVVTLCQSVARSNAYLDRLLVRQGGGKLEIHAGISAYGGQPDTKEKP